MILRGAASHCLRALTVPLPRMAPPPACSVCLRLAPRRHASSDSPSNPTTRQSTLQQQQQQQQQRHGTLSPEAPATGPNQDQLPHVSEEAASMSEITGDEGPDLSQGTPIEEVLQRDQKATESAPKVLKEAAQKVDPKGTKAFSTLARLRQNTELQSGPPDGTDEALAHGALAPSSANQEQEQPIPDENALTPSESESFTLSESDRAVLFPEMPSLPARSSYKSEDRQVPIVHQFTRLMMRHGRLAEAERNAAEVLNNLRRTSPPTYDPEKQLVAEAPPASHLPLDPVLYLTVAIDSVAPLLRLRTQKGSGGASVLVPHPINQRNRRRIALRWVLDTAHKKLAKGCSAPVYCKAIADELRSVIEGRSGAWDKRRQLHRQGVVARANLPKGRFGFRV